MSSSESNAADNAAENAADAARAERAARNRRNAQKSTGPRTPHGKRRVSQNALKHGIYADSTVIPGEDPDALDELRDAFASDLCATSEVEHELVNAMADAAWRRRRYARIEADIFERAMLAREREIDAAIEDGDLTDDRILAADAALDDAAGRRFDRCQRAGARASREFRQALGDIIGLRRQRGPGRWRDSIVRVREFTPEARRWAAERVNPDNYPAAGYMPGTLTLPAPAPAPEPEQVDDPETDNDATDLAVPRSSVTPPRDGTKPPVPPEAWDTGSDHSRIRD
jgi:hypothetical protein